MNLENFSSLWMFGAGAICGSLGLWFFHYTTTGGYKKLAAEMILKAESESISMKAAMDLKLKQKEFEQQREFDKILLASKKKLTQEDERIKQREDKLETRMNLVEKKLSDIEKREAVLFARRERLEDEKKEVKESQQRLVQELEKVSSLTCLEAKALLLDKISSEIRTDSGNLAKKLHSEVQENAEFEATKIISTAIQRIAASVVSDACITTVSLPNDEMKGRIIGKEGRNIRALEIATGINFIIDDTPGAVVLSGFDPIRKHVAKSALSELILDGRIHPTRIEEVVQKAKENTTKQIKAYGEDAALRAGAMNLHPEIITLLGKLKFRYSYGQNVLDHSLEVSHLMGLMAAELGLNVALAKRIGLLHDMGKAVSHEIEGSHAIIGHNFALKYGELPEVANGIGCHHFEMEAQTFEASLCASADTISAARPGARIESVEHYIRRLQKLEEIAGAIPGVITAYAMQAGREIRILVEPEMIDDQGLVLLARDVAKKVETGLNYPGKIKVTVIREKRATEYAL